jgi:hypothetical protein
MEMTRKVEFFMRGKTLIQEFDKEIIIPDGCYAYIIHHWLFGTLFSPLHVIGEEVSYDELTETEKRIIKKGIRLIRAVNGRLFPLSKNILLN